MLTFYEVSSFGGVGTSWVERKYLRCERCPACGSRIEPKSFENAKLRIAGKGSKWPDILACNLLLFHERVVEAIQANGLTGYKAHPTEIIEIQNERLKKIPIPQYYLIEAIGRVDIDEVELNGCEGGICPICFRRTVLGAHKRVVPLLETWDGSDFVKTRNWDTGLVYCTKRFVDLACQHRWTNFRFGSGQSMPGIGMCGNATGDRVSYYDPDWFPKLSAKVKAKYPDLFA